MKYFDTHTHTNVEPLDQEFNDILIVLEEKNLYINIVSCNLEDGAIAIEQAKQSPFTYCSLAIHPNDVKGLDLEKTMAILKQRCLDNKDKVLCIGECGLDYHYDNDEETIANQKRWFEAHIALARELGLTLMLHIRDAHDDAIEIIKKHREDNLTWIIHCYSAGKEYAKQYLDLGCYISIPGIVTFKKSDELREAVSIIPLNKMLTETDAPWLAPVPHRGKTNYPYYVLETNRYLAEYLNIDLDTLNDQLYHNAVKAFKMLK